MDMVSKNFSVKEMECRCGCGSCAFEVEFIDKLQALRDKLDMPLHITSGFRCPEHNKACGGKMNSKHMLGIAVDISTHGISSGYLYHLIREAIELGFRGIGLGSSFVHLDTRRSKNKMWVYSIEKSVKATGGFIG